MRVGTRNAATTALVGAAILAICVGSAKAHTITVKDDAIDTSTGIFTYMVTLDSTTEINAGGGFVIYDFGGYVPNSATLTPLTGNGTFVVSMRNTWAAYKVNIATGKIEWTLGGPHSDFKFGPGAEFEWQHDVVVYPNSPLVTMFDARAGRSSSGWTSVVIADMRANERSGPGIWIVSNWEGGTAAGPSDASLRWAFCASDSAAGDCSRPSVVKLQGSRTISSGLIEHNLHRLDFHHQNTEVSDFHNIL